MNAILARNFEKLVSVTEIDCMITVSNFVNSISNSKSSSEDLGNCIKNVKTWSRPENPGRDQNATSRDQNATSRDRNATSRDQNATNRDQRIPVATRICIF